MSDYMFVLESDLDAAQNKAGAVMQRIATEAGMNVWLTGGAMRDTLRGGPDSSIWISRSSTMPSKRVRHLLNRLRRQWFCLKTV